MGGGYKADGMTPRHVAYCTEIALAVGVASNNSFAGHTGHVTPRLGLFGSPLRANAPNCCLAGWAGRNFLYLADLSKILAKPAGKRVGTVWLPMGKTPSSDSMRVPSQRFASSSRMTPRTQTGPSC